ncbi:MAG: 7-carboxy-7-deazaguanine synthase QueE [Candidatus Omnitrophota bacterium]
MKITEIFQSIQGEGPYIGHRSIFIRTFGCNLGCSFGDTPYSWQKGSIHYDMSIHQILDMVCQASDVTHVVITGGEPTIQPELNELITNLKELGKIITIETNGTNMISNPQLVDKIMVSPKDMASAEKWLGIQNAEFKFVINEKNIDSTLQWLRQKGITKAYLMPMSNQANDALMGSVYILDKITENHDDHIICPRLHLLMGLK